MNGGAAGAARKTIFHSMSGVASSSRRYDYCYSNYVIRDSIKVLGWCGISMS